MADLSQLAPPLADAVGAMMADPAVGRLTVTSGWRSRAAQERLRAAHCGAANVYNPNAKCSPPTAVPGRSKHEAVDGAGRPAAQAVDLGGDLAGAHRVMARYGLVTPVAGEPWHFELAASAGRPAVTLSSASATQSAVNSRGTAGAPSITIGDPIYLAGSPSIWLRLAMFTGGAVALWVAAMILIPAPVNPPPPKRLARPVKVPQGKPGETGGLDGGGGAVDGADA